jgi:hypothetical protein
MQQLDGVRVAELAGREAPADARPKRDVVQLQPGGADRKQSSRRCPVPRGPGSLLSIPLPLIRRQLGHSHLSTTGTYLQRNLLRGDHLHRPRPARADGRGQCARRS